MCLSVRQSTPRSYITVSLRVCVCPFVRPHLGRTLLSLCVYVFVRSSDHTSVVHYCLFAFMCLSLRQSTPRSYITVSLRVCVCPFVSPHLGRTLLFLCVYVFVRSSVHTSVVHYCLCACMCLSVRQTTPRSYITVSVRVCVCPFVIPHLGRTLLMFTFKSLRSFNNRLFQTS